MLLIMVVKMTLVDTTVNTYKQSLPSSSTKTKQISEDIERKNGGLNVTAKPDSSSDRNLQALVLLR